MNNQSHKITAISIWSILIILLLLIVTLNGVLSFPTYQDYEISNQYGEKIRIYGTGVYAHDSFFKAPIFIGTDFTMLFLVVPLLIITLLKNKRKSEVEAKINLLAMLGVILYYAMSISFGVTYNYLHLIYIMLMGVSFYLFFGLLLNLHTQSTVTPPLYTYTITRGMQTFLICSGLSLFIAWLPDIISSLTANRSLELIEVYTTEITYVIDMGIISPLMFITLYLLRKKSFIGLVLFRMLLRTCEIIGIMLPIQSVFQLISGIKIPLPVLLTKVAIFVALAGFALYTDFSVQRKTVVLG